MTCQPPLTCNDDARRAAVQDPASGVNGIEAVEVVPKPDGDPLVQRVLAVYFFHGIPPGLDKTKLRIEGGTRVPGSSIKILDANAVSGRLEVTLDRFGDFSDYFLGVDHPSLDPLYRCRSFNFKVLCDNPFDCKPPARPSSPLPADPRIDYLARDYASLRRALLDFLTLRVPGFDETNEADLAVTLAELFAYAGDQLSYMQDAVANERYLDTARQRRSVKRHARLVDYRMHDGLAARTFLFFEVASGVPGTVKLPIGTAVATADEDPARAVVFETEESIDLDLARNRLIPHTWGNSHCCLPRGSTSVDLKENQTTLKVGQSLLIEEELGPVTAGNGSVVLVRAAADRDRRQVVTINRVEFLTDPLEPAGHQDVTRVTWDLVDALRFNFCLESNSPKEPATVVRGNLARASHGATVPLEDLDLSTLTLNLGPLTWLTPWGTTDPAQGRSTVKLRVDGEVWSERATLLDSGPDATDFVVETDNAGRGVLRFGGRGLGRALTAEAVAQVRYRVGNGAGGNLGADTLTTKVLVPAEVRSVRNPLPATGGVDPQPIEEVRRDASEAFRRLQYRAVTEDDYAGVAKGVIGVSDAAATFRWTGSWLTVFEAIDPKGREEPPAPLIGAVTARLDTRRQAGYDLEVRGPTFVPLEIELVICVRPEYFRGDVLRAVSEKLSNRLQPDGSIGLFHPDNFRFGQPFYLSRLYAAAVAVEGVLAAHVSTFKRLNRADYGEKQAGVITVGPFEVIRLDNDPSFPDNGVLRLIAEGGK
ncbi:baseplate J/gp47 family protein [Tundrisphaera lichenicola]|uniref:baseplate J/gp47 family protein n=1 Tax=Tundrisphaera lichenicola TaxID=2029860 RepID=UPI003EB88E53